MSKDPAVLFYTSDFLSGTSFFSYEEKGQYITLLCQQHQKHGIPLNHMINICGSLDSEVAKKFIKGEDGLYYNERMREEGIKRSQYCESRKNNKEGINQYTKKSGHMTKHTTSHMTGHMENENEDENVSKIVEYLNKKTGKNFNPKTKETEKLISARLKEGRKYEQFVDVIDKKCAKWKDDVKMTDFLRPSTLFRPTNFENYLNENGGKDDIDHKIFRDQ